MIGQVYIPTALTSTVSEYDSKQTWILLLQGEKKNTDNTRNRTLAIEPLASNFTELPRTIKLKWFNSKTGHFLAWNVFSDNPWVFAFITVLIS